MLKLLLCMFSCFIFLDAAHLRQYRGATDTDTVCPIRSCFARYEGRVFYTVPLTPEQVEKCSVKSIQFHQCIRDRFQNDLDTICQACDELQVRLGLETNQTSIQVLQQECPQLCDINGENEQCLESCRAIERDMWRGGLQPQDVSRINACEECQQQVFNRCPTSWYYVPEQLVWHARITLDMNGCPLPERDRQDCDEVYLYGSNACREDLPEQLTTFLACVDKDIEELAQCDGLKELHQLEMDRALREAAEACSLVKSAHNFRVDKCQI